MTGAVDTQLNTYKVKYAYVEMILNKESKYDVIAGLFKGIIEKDGETFILLHGLKGATAVLNTAFYNVLSIEVLEEDYKYMTYLTCESTDQELGSQMLDELYADFMKYDFGLTNDPTIIDIEKYSDVPKDFLDGKPLNKSVAQSGTAAGGVGSFANSPKQYARNNSAVGYGAATTRKEPEPAIFSRSKSKKPVKTDLDLMQEKIDQIKAGDFTPTLPETMEDDGDGVSDDYDDDLYGTYGYNRGVGFC